MKKCAECGKEIKIIRFNHVINRWYCKDCWTRIIGPKSAARAFGVISAKIPKVNVMEKKEIENVLVPLDGSKNSWRGLESAIYHTKKHKATLNVIHVRRHMPKNLSNERRVSLQNKIESLMNSAKKLAEKNSIEFKSGVLTGDPRYEIVRYADSHPIDLIVMGARGCSLKKIFLGSVSKYVVQRSKLPVLVVK